jgi:mannose-6-phosphate isomerase-like protein (cupin superfamily)
MMTESTRQEETPMTTYERSSDRARPTPREPIVRRPGEGHVIPGPEGLTVKASGRETGGAIGFLEGLSPPGFGPPRHVHHTCDELFYILDGELEFALGDEVVRATAGTFVFIPRGTVHAPKVVGEKPGRVLVAFTPGGAERAFDELAELASAPGAGGTPDPAKAQHVALKYESEFVGPPL